MDYLTLATLTKLVEPDATITNSKKLNRLKKKNRLHVLTFHYVNKI